jgi:hypothetical protein
MNLAGTQSRAFDDLALQVAADYADKLGIRHFGSVVASVHSEITVQGKAIGGPAQTPSQCQYVRCVGARMPVNMVDTTTLRPPDKVNCHYQ